MRAQVVDIVRASAKNEPGEDLLNQGMNRRQAQHLRQHVDLVGERPTDADYERHVLDVVERQPLTERVLRRALSQKGLFVHLARILRPPAGARGWQCSGPTECIDMTTTLRRIAMVASPEGSPGRSLLSQLQAGPLGLAAQRGRAAVFDGLSGYSMVRTESHNVLVLAGTTREAVKLYDLRSDPQEERNLAFEPSFTDLK